MFYDDSEAPGKPRAEAVSCVCPVEPSSAGSLPTITWPSSADVWLLAAAAAPRPAQTGSAVAGGDGRWLGPGHCPSRGNYIDHRMWPHSAATAGARRGLIPAF